MIKCLIVCTQILVQVIVSFNNTHNIRRSLSFICQHFEELVGLFKFGCFSRQLFLDITWSENILKIDPLPLQEYPIVKNFRKINELFLPVFSFSPERLDVSWAKNSVNRCQGLIKSCVNIIDIVKYENKVFSTFFVNLGLVLSFLPSFVNSSKLCA